MWMRAKGEENLLVQLGYSINDGKRNTIILAGKIQPYAIT